MDNYTVIILGATGDLTKRKLLPSLHALLSKSGSKVLIVGAARGDAMVHALLDDAAPFIQKKDDAAWEQLRSSFHYQQLDFTVAKDYVALEKFVCQLEKKHNMSGKRLIYLATAAHFFCTITENLSISGLAKRVEEKDSIWNRIAYEKPFGHDLKSAHEINECIKKYFYEYQIYRVDHYLNKEVVANIALLRFTNIFFEPLWNHRYIDNVQIILNEKIGVESRGGYYDSYGAVADVVQNHMLELLALVAMESPAKLTGDAIRTERAKVLKKVSVVEGFLGQYKGYTQEKDVPVDSTTETFAAFRFAIDNRRWTGVPFYLKTGKKLKKKETVIHIRFKHVDCLLSKDCPSEPNYLTIRITPDATFALTLNTKKIDKTNEVSPVKMEFCHSCHFGDVTPTAYETLFEEIVRGELSTSVRFDEIEYAWKIIDNVREMKLPLHLYEVGSLGPKAALQDFSNKHGIRWRE